MRNLIIIMVVWTGFTGCMVKPMIITPYVPKKQTTYSLIDSMLYDKPPVILNLDGSFCSNNSGRTTSIALMGGIGLTIPLGTNFFLKNEFTVFNLGLSTALGFREPNNFAVAAYNRIVRNGLFDSTFCFRNNFFPGVMVTKSLLLRPRIYYGTFFERNGFGGTGGGWGFPTDIGDPLLDLGLIFGIYPVEMRLYTHNLTPRGIGWQINFIFEH